MKKLVSPHLTLDSVDIKTGNKLLNHRKDCRSRSDYFPSDALRIYLPLYLERLELDNNWQGFGPWLIREKKEKQIVGEIVLLNGLVTTKVLDIGYQIIPSQRGKGYATEAVSLLCKWAFSLNTNKITACCDIHNIASHKVLYKNGFKLEIVDRDCMYLFRKKENKL